MESRTGLQAKPIKKAVKMEGAPSGRLSSFLFGFLFLFYFGYGPYAIYQNWQQCNDAAPGIWGDAACKSPMKARPRLNLGREYQLHGWDDKAFDEYQAVIALTSAGTNQASREIRVSAATNIALLLIQREAYDHAESIAHQILEEYPYFPPAEVVLSNIYLLTKRYSEAVLEVDHALQGSQFFADTSVGRLHLTRGIAYRALGRCELAVVDFDIARKLDPDITDVPFCP